MDRVQSFSPRRRGRHVRVRKRTWILAGSAVLFLVCVSLRAAAPIAVLSVTDKPPADMKDQEAPPPRAMPPAGPMTYDLPVEPIVKTPAPKDEVEDLARTPPVVPAAVREAPIDLFSALRLAERQNPNIGIAVQAIRLALAEQARAAATWLPHMRAGTNYHAHQGVLQTSFGLMRNVDSQALYFGAGARTLAAETVAFPGVQFYNHLGDAIFEPLAARQQVTVNQFRAAAVSNAVLLEVALRFLDLLNAEGELEAIRQSEKEMNLLVQITAIFAKQGAGRDADARRARSEALLLHTQEQAAEEKLAVAAAELARVLHLDPSVRLRTPAQKIAMLQIVDPAYPLEQLIQIAQRARPEMAALQAEVARKVTQVRQEKYRPLFPTVWLGYSAGGFGGSSSLGALVPNPGFGKFNARVDFDVLAYWTLQNMGAGNVAATHKRQAERQITQTEQVRMLNQIRREVASALALTEARRQQVDFAMRRLAVAKAAFLEDYTRIRGNLGLPIEVLDSMRRLVDARLNVIAALASYNQGQFQLFVAVGQTPLAANADVNPPNQDSPK